MWIRTENETEFQTLALVRQQPGQRSERPLDRPPHARFDSTQANTSISDTHNRPPKSLTKVGMSQILGFKNDYRFDGTIYLNNTREFDIVDKELCPVRIRLFKKDYLETCELVVVDHSLYAVTDKNGLAEIAFPEKKQWIIKIASNPLNALDSTRIELNGNTIQQKGLRLKCDLLYDVNNMTIYTEGKSLKSEANSPDTID